MTMRSSTDDVVWATLLKWDAIPRKTYGSQPMTPVERAATFWARVDKSGACWVWTGAIGSGGYGNLWGGRRAGYQNAHCVAYVLSCGPVPDGMELDHLCRDRACVNPQHLEPVSHRENIRRGMSPAAGLGERSHCIRGHEFTPENTRLGAHRGRSCRECARLHSAAYQRGERLGAVS